MLAEKHVRYFNRLNGNSISKKKLIKFHNAIKKDLESKRIDAHVPFGVEVIDIEKKIAKAIKAMNGHSHVDRLDVKPIPLNRYRVPVTSKKPANELGVIDIYGLECLPGESGLGFTAEGQKKIYDMVTDMVEKAMKKDGLFWRNAWDSFKLPAAQSYPALRKYNGANFFLLNLFALYQHGYSSPYFLTFKQINELSGNLRKKAEGWPVIFYTMLYKQDGKNISEAQYEALSREQRAKVSVFPIIQYYRVFNAQDVENVQFPKYDQAIQSRPEPERIEAAEKIVSSMKNRPDIDHGNRRAHYIPSSDKIDMPDRKSFTSEHRYYSVLFHELIHSTGHKSRLDRDMSGDHDSKEYAFEELVAELGATYLCAESGILYHTVNDSAAYVKMYSEQIKEIIKDDNKFFLKAAAAAQKAADYILGRSSAKEKKPAAPAKAVKTKSRKPERKSVGSYEPTEKELKVFVQLVKDLKNKDPYKNEQFLWQDFDKKQRIAFGIETDKVSKLFVKTSEGVGDFKFSMHGMQYRQSILKYDTDANDVSRLLSTKSNKAKGTPQPNHQETDNKGGVSGLPAAKKSKSIGGIMKAGALAGLNFMAIALTGEWLKMFTRMFSDTVMMIWGLPGSGKTVLLLRLANYFLKDLKKRVLYISHEEFGRSTLTQKLKDHNISPDLDISGRYDDSIIDNYDVIFMDSVNSMKFSPADLKRMIDAHPNKIWVLIVQTTKDGDFRGGQDWEHLVDVAGEVVNRKLILRKNRNDPKNKEKADKLRVADIVNVKKQQAEIKEMVRRATTKKEVEQPKQ